MIPVGSDPASIAVGRVLGMALLGFAAGAAVELLYDLHAGNPPPRFVPLIAGLGCVGVWLNTASVLVQFVGQQPTVLDNAVTNTVALAGGGAAALGGARVGRRLVPDLRALSGAHRLDREVSDVVRTVGRVATVRLPGRIDDIDGYESVPDETKEALAGADLVFPRGLTVDELRGRLVDRLRGDYAVGHVDVELTAEATVTYLALGGRAAGIGSTLPPGSSALAVTANPAFGASPGDRVRVWERADEGADRVTTAELWATNGDVVTLTADTDRLRAIDPTAEHRLVTLPARKRPEREFAALLRTADEGVESIVVESDSDLRGVPVGALRPTVAAIRGDGGALVTLPTRTRRLDAGDTVYAIGRRDELRKLASAAASD